jgi:hypothetical protein
MRLLRRIAGSISFRSRAPLRRVVEMLPLEPCPPKPVAPFRLLTLVGRSHVSILTESLLSIARTWDRYPEIVVATDGSIAPAEVERRLGWWPGPLRAEDGERYVSAMAREGRDDVVRFARRNPMGIKLAAVLVSAREAPTFAADSDVLWFGDFSAAVARLASRPEPLVLCMSEDFQASYQWEIVAALGDDVRTPPWANAGVTFLKGDLLAAVDLAPGLAVAAEMGNFIGEQTLLACAARRLGAPFFPPESIVCFNSDSMTLGVTFRGRRWTARHYIGPVRHMFWRDALALRLGVRP